MKTTDNNYNNKTTLYLLSILAIITILLKWNGVRIPLLSTGIIAVLVYSANKKGKTHIKK